MNLIGQRRMPARAFTLIEVLLAVMICAIVLAAINGVFYGALHLRSKTSEAIDLTAPRELAMVTLRRDLQGVVPLGGVFGSSFRSGSVANNLGQNVNLEIFTATGVISDFAPWGDIQKITYQLVESTDRTRGAGKDLIRGVTTNLLFTGSEQMGQRWMMGGIEKLEVSCFDGFEWRDTWDTTMSETNLPLAVRVRLHLAADGPSRARRQDQPMELLVLLDAQGRTNQVASTTATQ